VHFRSHAYDAYRSTVSRLAQAKNNTGPLLPDTPKAPPPGLPPLAVDHFHAAMWYEEREREREI
jgi:hypothetical protein